MWHDHNHWRCYECQFPDCLGCKAAGRRSSNPSVAVPQSALIDDKDAPHGPGYYCTDCKFPPCECGARRVNPHGRWRFKPYKCDKCRLEGGGKRCLKCNVPVSKATRVVKDPKAPEGPGHYCLACHYPPCDCGAQRKDPRSNDAFTPFECGLCEKAEGKRCLSCNAPVSKTSRMVKDPKAPKGPGYYCSACQYPPCGCGTQRKFQRPNDAFTRFDCGLCERTCQMCTRKATGCKLIEDEKAPNGTGYYCATCLSPPCGCGAKRSRFNIRFAFKRFVCTRCP